MWAIECYTEALCMHEDRRAAELYSVLSHELLDVADEIKQHMEMFLCSM